MEYKLIAFDMDGTLLNSNKQISKKTQEAIARAVAYNKIVILNTGRNSAELESLKVAGLAVMMDNASISALDIPLVNNLLAIPCFWASPLEFNVLINVA